MILFCTCLLTNTIFSVGKRFDHLYRKLLKEVYGMIVVLNTSISASYRHPLFISLHN